MRGALNHWVGLLGLLLLLAQGAQAAPTPLDHQIWDELLQTHVVALQGGHASAVDYAGMLRDRPRLKGYLTRLAQVAPATFARWQTPEQLAFLLNAYNAWTVELILSRYPNLTSIKDLGGLFTSPWEVSFIPLLGKNRSLDDIEHKLIRGNPAYHEPRIHFALNCASRGCPALLPHAYVGATLDQQLDAAITAFLGDRSRNHLADGALQISSLFKWYRDDFKKGWRDADSLGRFLALYGQALGLNDATRRDLAAGRLPIEFLTYDWRLNDAGATQ